jgi:hypothetical protein
MNLIEAKVDLIQEAFFRTWDNFSYRQNYAPVPAFLFTEATGHPLSYLRFVKSSAAVLDNLPE